MEHDETAKLLGLRPKGTLFLRCDYEAKREVSQAAFEKQRDEMVKLLTSPKNYLAF